MLTWIVVLKDQNAFERFQPRDSNGKRMGNVGGYFTRLPDANVMVFGAGREEDNYRVHLEYELAINELDHVKHLETAPASTPSASKGSEVER